MFTLEGPCPVQTQNDNLLVKVNQKQIRSLVWSISSFVLVFVIDLAFTLWGCWTFRVAQTLNGLSNSEKKWG